MSQENEQMSPLQRLVLVVPVHHVKTVKSALEQCDQLDRTSKITPETEESGQAESTEHHSHSNKSPDTVSQPRDQLGNTASSSVTTQFPALEFDPVSGEYRDPANIPRSTSLQFDPDSGEYRKPADSQKFHKLQFDAATGEYKAPAEAEQHQALEFDVASGQYREQSTKPQLRFDPESGEYRSETEPRKIDREKNTVEQRMRIPTTFPYESIEESEHKQQFISAILDTLSLSHLAQSITFAHSTSNAATTPATAGKSNPLRKALHSTLESLQHSLLDPLSLTHTSLVAHFSDSYTLYHPMLLLPHTTFSSTPWQTLLSAHPADSAILQPLWQNLAKAVGATHIAINSPIPPQTQEQPSTTTPTTIHNQPLTSNILRIPLNIIPLSGNFGPPPTPGSLSHPTPTDFAQAFWVQTTQHGIHQTWAPLYTMFSRGNITEKTRIHRLAAQDTTLTAVSSHGSQDRDQAHESAAAAAAAAAADFYAGIGYFAFSYRKAGVKPVVCWELNPWSVEGLRRGARLNQWGEVRIVRREEVEADASMSVLSAEASSWSGIMGEEQQQPAPDFVVFQTTNATAVTLLPRLGDVGSRIRRVNLGLLPSSEQSWGTAVRVLLQSRYSSLCWVHAHENVAVGDIERRAGEVEAEFQRLVEVWEGEGHGARRVRVRHVERVKMYAPGVAHCVFDVCIEG